METQIKKILQKQFPDAGISNVQVIDHGSHRKMKCKISGKLFYLSFLPSPARQEIYRLLNNDNDIY